MGLTDWKMRFSLTSVSSHFNQAVSCSIVLSSRPGDTGSNPSSVIIIIPTNLVKPFLILSQENSIGRKNIISFFPILFRFLAKKRFKNMKKEAKSVEHVKKLNKGLENKIISLQQRIGELVSVLESRRSWVRFPFSLLSWTGFHHRNITGILLLLLKIIYFPKLFD